MGYMSGPTLDGLLRYYEWIVPAHQPTTAGHPTEECGHCGKWHNNSPCPRIKAIEYFESGVIRRVEYHDKIGS
jgi:hypothetical protein